MSSSLLFWSAATLTFVYLMKSVSDKPFQGVEADAIPQFPPITENTMGSQFGASHHDIVNIRREEGGYLGMPVFYMDTATGESIRVNRISG